MYCVNHPSIETRVTCSNCGDPICPDCMVFTPVGAKCPDCARMPKSALVRLKPERLALAAVAGLGAATAGGYAFGLLFFNMGALRFFAFLLAFGLGMAVGEAVSWASGRYHGPRLAAWAAACAALGIAFPFLLLGVAGHGLAPEALRFALIGGGLWQILWMAAAAYGAWQRNA